MRTRVKICCMASANEARLAVVKGADAVGVVGPMPGGPGIIDLATARRIVAMLPPAVASFLLSSKTDEDQLIAEIEAVRPSAVQIVDAVNRKVFAALRARLPALKIVQVVHVEDERAIDEALPLTEHVDALLLDSGRPKAAVRELGGTGRTHDWRISRKIVEQSGKPVFLAGGLRPDNVEEAVATVRPFGVDLCSGVRTDGHLDRSKVDAFMAAVRRADQSAATGIA